MPRFFRRLAEGVFDEGEVHRCANELAGFVEDAREVQGSTHPLQSGSPTALTSAATAQQLRPEILAGAVLLRAMVPLKEPLQVDHPSGGARFASDNQAAFLKSGCGS